MNWHLNFGPMNICCQYEENLLRTLRCRTHTRNPCISSCGLTLLNAEYPQLSSRNRIRLSNILEGSIFLKSRGEGYIILSYQIILQFNMHNYILLFSYSLICCNQNKPAFYRCTVRHHNVFNIFSHSGRNLYQSNWKCMF